MPLYEYQCNDCGHRFELIRKFSDEPVSTCPKCDGTVQKLLSSPAFQFKGTGWYITDYARKPSEGKGADGAESPDKTKKKDGTSTGDSKSTGDSSKKEKGKSGDSSSSSSSSSSVTK